VALVGSFLPDLDHPGSSISRLTLFKPVSYVAWKSFGHRGALHSIVAASLVYVVAVYFLHDSAWARALAWGYLAHILADALTVQGVPLLWPFTNERFGMPSAVAAGSGCFLEFLYVVSIAVTAVLWAVRLI